jgi:cell cycle arrest protein BUB3
VRDINCFSNEKGFAACSVEGRIGIDFFEPQETLVPFNYKCHRKTVKSNEMTDETFIYPVNTLRFHPTYNTFVSGGSDGEIMSWDPAQRKRIWRKEFPIGITSLDFNSSGTKLAVGCGYNYDNDETDQSSIPVPFISIIQVKDSNVRPKKS